MEKVSLLIAGDKIKLTRGSSMGPKFVCCTFKKNGNEEKDCNFYIALGSCQSEADSIAKNIPEMVNYF